MSTLASGLPLLKADEFQPLPDHTQLPDKDGAIVTNIQENPQSRLLISSIEPVLQRLHPDGQYAVGMDVGIYYRYRHPDQHLCKAPDWVYVPDVPPMLEGRIRRSFILWQETIAPGLLIEYVSGDGSEERDRTPETGKFWVYERVIHPAFYAIYEVSKGRVEVFNLVNNRFRRVAANERGHFPIPPLEVELGIWQGRFANLDLPWLRYWDAEGNLLLSGEERAEQEHQRAEQEHQRAEQERQRAEQAKLAVRQEHQRAEQEHQRAEQEHQRAERLAALLRSLGQDPDALR